MAEQDPSQPWDGEEQYSAGDLQTAYHQAAQQGDQEAMQQLHGALLRNYQRNAYSPTEGVSGAQLYGEGVGHGNERLNEGLVNALGAGRPVQAVADWMKKVPYLRALPLASGHFTNEELKDEDKYAKPLLDTGAGTAGDISGQITATAPVGMATGALARGGGAALARVLPAALARFAPGAVKTGVAAAENATQGAATADPEHQGEGAESAAVLGAALSKLGQAGGRVVRGLVKKNEATQALEAAANAEGRDVMIPISQGAAKGGLSGVGKSLYQHVLPFALGVEDRLGGQSEEAQKELRTVAAQQNILPFYREQGITVPPRDIGGKTAEQTAANMTAEHEGALKKYFDDYAFETPLNFRDQVVSDLKHIHPNMPEALREQLATTVDKKLQLFSSDGQITGENLRGAMEAAERDGAKLGKDYKPMWVQSAVGSMGNLIDQAVAHHEDILRTSENLKDTEAAREFLSNMENYKALAQKDRGVAGVVRATENAPAYRGEYSWPELARQSHPGDKNYELAQNATEVFGENPGQVTSAGRHIWHALPSVSALMGGAATGHGRAGMLAPALLLSGGHLMANPSTQRFLYGEGALGAQKWLANQLRKYPASAYGLGGAVRAGAVANQGQQ